MQIVENPSYSDTIEAVYQVERRLLSLLTEEDYESLSQLALDSVKRLGKSGYLYDWALGALAMQKDVDEIEGYLSKSLQQCVWFSKNVLSDLLEDYCESPRLASYIERHERLYLENLDKNEAQILIRTPRIKSPDRRYPLLIFLDGRHADHTISQYYWKPVLEEIDIIFASVRSSQIHGFGQYAWDDLERALGDVQEAYEILRDRDDVDEAQVIICGMSQGTNIVMHAIARNIIPVRGFITVAQALKPDLFFNNEPPTLLGRNLRGVILSGEKNEPRHPSHRKFHALALESGIDCKLHSYPDSGHEYPKDFTSRAIQSIKYILR